MAGAPQAGGAGQWRLVRAGDDLCPATTAAWNKRLLAGEVRDSRRNMMRILVGGILAVAVLYLLVNSGSRRARPGRMRESKRWPPT